MTTKLVPCLFHAVVGVSMLLVVTVRHADLASAVQVMEGCWNEWSRHASSWHHQALFGYTSCILQDAPQFHGKYASLRSKLDYTYHSHYTRERQALQDDIIDSILNSTSSTTSNSDDEKCKNTAPWIVFTAGAMGAGKSWSIRKLSQRGYFPLDSFVTVDQDEIRHLLPEFNKWLQHYPHLAGEWTRKEAGYIAELLTLVALQQKQHVLVDGTLRNASWYALHFQDLRRAFVAKIAILHVTAPRHFVLKRAQDRSKTTGRVVPRHRLEEALVQVPKSVDVLKNQVDYFAELSNGETLELSTGETWQDFAQTWSLDSCVQKQ